ncbi:glycosyltransferase family 4 protein [Acinetobacter kanungonis]|uniref:glycosyltransferase family 4 protein n=1 Tax=Acinetobacter kanungonis TaxID=2699469 RepID=UPI00137AF25C|nr:glycosyltransferase family 4 protein [Acinetobacter kanungonis]NCI79689.1 glycosyltransferase family 4 protein [Acinetobacter kanungonis]
MKNICFLIGNVNHSGGTERVTSLIANKLSNKHRIHILSLNEGHSPFFELNQCIIIDSLFDKYVSQRSHFFSTIIKIRKYIIAHNIDTLVVVDSISCVFTVSACFGLKVNHICWEHFNIKVNLGSYFRDLGRWMASKWCTKIVTLTSRDKQFWEAKFGLSNTDKVVAISNPSPFQYQSHVPSLEFKNILSIGRLTHQKGFDHLIGAWAKISKQLPEWRITIVGSGEDDGFLRQMAKENNVENSIDFVGQQKNVDKFYRKASFFCLSSRFEGLPMVLLEAQSYGLPIVAYDCDTGPAELVTNQNGYLVEKQNIDELASALMSMAKLNEYEFSALVNENLKMKDNFGIDRIIIFWENIV